MTVLRPLIGNTCFHSGFDSRSTLAMCEYWRRRLGGPVSGVADGESVSKGSKSRRHSVFQIFSSQPSPCTTSRQREHTPARRATPRPSRCEKSMASRWSSTRSKKSDGANSLRATMPVSPALSGSSPAHAHAQLGVTLARGSPVCVAHHDPAQSKVRGDERHGHTQSTKSRRHAGGGHGQRPGAAMRGRLVPAPAPLSVALTSVFLSPLRSPPASSAQPLSPQPWRGFVHSTARHS